MPILSSSKLRVLKCIQVYFHIATTTKPHTDKFPLFHIYSGLYFLGCAHKHLYQYMIQKGLVQLKGAMYPM